MRDIKTKLITVEIYKKKNQEKIMRFNTKRSRSIFLNICLVGSKHNFTLRSLSFFQKYFSSSLDFRMLIKIVDKLK